jgi:hypothetical protein
MAYAVHYTANYNTLQQVKCSHLQPLRCRPHQTSRAMEGPRVQKTNLDMHPPKKDWLHHF